MPGTAETESGQVTADHQLDTANHGKIKEGSGRFFEFYKVVSKGALMISPLAHLYKTDWRLNKTGARLPRPSQPAS